MFQIPEDLDFESVLDKATVMCKEYPLSKIQGEVDQMIANE